MRIVLNSFRSHIDSEYTVPDSGLTLLSGPSGSGKSTLLTGILFALYGKVRKPYTFGRKTCKVELSILDMKVVRTRSPNRLIVTVGKKTYEDDEAQSVIDNCLGLTYEEFLCSSYIRQKENASIVSMNQTEQIALIERIAFQDSKHTFYKDCINNLIKEKNSKLADITSKIEISRENLKRLESKVGEFPVKTCPIESDNPLEDNEDAIKEVKRTLEELNREKEDVRTSIQDIERTKQKFQTLLEEKRTLQGKYSGLEMQINSLPLLMNHEKLTDTERRTEELESEIEDIKLYRLGREMWREYKRKYDEKMEEYAKKMEECREKLLSNTELQRIQNTVKTAYVVENNSMTPQEAKAKLMLLVREIKANCKMNNIKTTNSIVSFLEKKTNSLRESIIKNEDLLKEYRTEAAKASVTSVTYECPCCNEKLLVDNDRLIKYVERESVDYDELVSKTIIALTNDRAAIGRNEQWIRSIKEYAKLSNCKEIVTRDELDELKAKLTVDSTYRGMYESVLQLYNEETMPDSIERLSSIALEVLTQYDRRRKEKPREYDVVKKELDDTANLLREQYSTKMTLNTLRMELDATHRSIKAIDKKLGTEGNLSKELSNFNVALVNIECRINDAHREFERLTELNSTIKQYNMYLSHCKEIEYAKTIITTFEKDIKVLEKEVEACLLLKRAVLDAEILALQRTIYDINEYSKHYLDLMFEKTPINVELKSIKYSKDTSKFQLNIQVDYKGESYDSVNQLSGGERDRVNLAFILGVNTMLRSRILMLDECLASLDGETNTEILEFLKDISENRAILVVSHEAVRGVFDTVVEI